MDGRPIRFAAVRLPMLSVKTDRQMAAARAEQSEQRERDQCEFHLIPLAVGQRGPNNFNAVDQHRTSRTNRPAPDPQHSIEEAPTTCVGIAGASFVPRPADRSGPTQNVPGNWYLLGSERLRSARTAVLHLAVGSRRLCSWPVGGRLFFAPVPIARRHPVDSMGAGFLD